MDIRPFQGAVIITLLIAVFVLWLQQFGGHYSMVLASFLGIVLGSTTVVLRHVWPQSTFRGPRGVLVLVGWIVPILAFTWTEHNLEVALLTGCGVATLSLCEGVVSVVRTE